MCATYKLVLQHTGCGFDEYQQHVLAKWTREEAFSAAPNTYGNWLAPNDTGRAPQAVANCVQRRVSHERTRRSYLHSKEMPAHVSKLQGLDPKILKVKSLQDLYSSTS